MEELIVTIQEGDIQVEVQGVKGARCLELTQAIEALLGKTSSRTIKEEFYGKVSFTQKICLNQTIKNPNAG
jgi:hypothetical protein